MGARRQAREAALQAMFMCDFLDQWDEETPVFCLDHFAVNQNARDYAIGLTNGVIRNLKDIDARITTASDHWSISRMGRVDRSIIRIATYEMAYMEDIPINVAINEAIEIAKRFGSDESPTFINGVLDRIASIYRSKQAPGSADAAVEEPPVQPGPAVSNE